MMCTYNAGSNAFTVFNDLQGPLPSRAIDLPRRQKRQARARSKWAYDSHGRCLPKKMLGNDTHGPVIEICLNKLRQALFWFVLVSLVVFCCCSFCLFFLFLSHSPQRKMTFPKTCRLTFAPLVFPLLFRLVFHLVATHPPTERPRMPRGRGIWTSKTCSTSSTSTRTGAWTMRK